MKLTYRPEIDGLRGIAVVAVILYHLQLTIFDHSLFKGGFIGVDIFFVISGYLITSLILKELETTGGFSFLHFYFGTLTDGNRQDCLFFETILVCKQIPTIGLV